ncbi:MAG TPA: cytochrome c peroxidase [Kofleriaceae bacterium]
MRATLLSCAIAISCKREAKPPPAPPPRPPAPAPAPAAAARSVYNLTSAKKPSAAALAALGKEIFHDRSLSASGAMACASCHDPSRAFGLPVGLAAGARAVPSLRYLQQVPRFTEHYIEGDGDGTDQGPTGGFMWDGRAQSTHDQARLPLFSPAEMANTNDASVAAKLRAAPYAATLRALFGDPAIADDTTCVQAMLIALEVYQQTPEDFYPYSSKYDAYIRGKAKLSPQEARGLALFESPAKGNCATCHTSRQKEIGFPAFSDWGFIAIGVPDAKDLGLCGRPELATHKEYCGMFRTPSLRNVATRDRFFHNGSIHTLRAAVSFYVTRKDTGAANLNREPPFGTKLADSELDDLVAFLGTLTDGWQATPPAPARP